ncbi:hypothetical protein [Flammeovirga aprica]|uniref:Uncharacterized protein n=1 Tax=Flammeovirga aprica JL-4 TaxID=694437 RepID=A0A7X9RW86_9BACT|nr:hypothetical protein [Flammeovirga aprica]NME69888.1 hypothetical protein [Flammeovirga aprica JL-4]
MLEKEDYSELIKHIKEGRKVKLSSSRILFGRIFTIIITTFVIALCSLYIVNHLDEAIHVPLITVSFCLLLIFLVLKISSFEIENHKIIVKNGFGKKEFKPEEIFTAKCFSFALADPFKQSYYTKLEFKKDGKFSTFYILNISTASDGFIEFPDILYMKIKNMYTEKTDA